ncbi:MAG: RNA polymerase sigma factor SigJ [Acidimicrobiales bacterium]|nr:RNA polymerase sigma factor SigJ [Acidimicrobiales bacterium]
MQDPTDVFEAERSSIRRVAYRMLGTPDDADDVVQEVWLRWKDLDHGAIDNAAAWLTTVATRISIDRATSARARREVYVGPWIPEPITITDVRVDEANNDPAASVVGAESLELGLLRILETLQPVERAVFLLHDVFGYPFAQIASTVDRSQPATRQIAKRARERVRAGRPRVDTEPSDVESLAEAFFLAVVDGDIDALMSLLTEDVVHISDGGAERHAARRPVLGPAKVARLLVNLTRRDLQPDDEMHWVRVNGQVGLYIVRRGEPFLLTLIGWRDTAAAEILAILNPRKLAHLHARWLEARAAP